MPHNINKFQKGEEILITKIDSIHQFLKKSPSLENCTFLTLDFTQLNIHWETLTIKNTTFLGCQLTIEEEMILRKKGAYVYHAPQHLPYQPFRTSLYNWQELMKGFSSEKDNSTDIKIYQHFSKNKFNPSINEALWQRVHDHAMDDSLRTLLQFDAEGMTQLRCVGFMGGHSTRRSDPFYKKTALTAKLLAENGYFIVSGGGPGIMEATNLGAYFSGKPHQELEDAINTLSKAAFYRDSTYHQRALEVIEKYPKGEKSLAIPTWFYGHEPSNLFATHIAKYFSNSIREDTLLAISLYGIVCAPGSAGTTQEIFMDATQNHYGTFNFYSPMVFLGRKRYEVDTMIYPLLRQLAYGEKYYDLLFLTDEPQEVLAFLKAHPPIRNE